MPNSRVLVLVAFLVLAVASPTEFDVFHRFIPSSRSGQGTPDFVPFGRVSLDPDVDPAGAFVNANDREPMMDDGRGMYQIGLKVGEDMLLTSTKSVSNCPN